MPRHMFSRFRKEIEMHGADAFARRTTLIEAAGADELFYMPCEHTNINARLVLVGITPGKTQIELAYAEAQRLIRMGRSEQDIMVGAKRLGAFGGPSMRPNLLRMMRHFGIARILGLSNEEELWGAASEQLHATSVVPHAAFSNGKMFAGPFERAQNSPIFRKCFLENFVPHVREMNPGAFYIALGPTPYAALKWCAEKGLVREKQILGSFAHPSTSSGSQVPYYLREKKLADLSSRDPIRSRARWLDRAYAEMLANTRRLHEEVSAVAQGTKAFQHYIDPTPAPISPVIRGITPEASSMLPAEGSREGFFFIVKRGKNSGVRLTPHVHRDGCYVVSPTRFEKDYIRVPQHERLRPWLARGFKLRMSASGIAPSLIAPESIEGSEQ